MHVIELYLSLPRFKVEEKYDLPGPLEHIRMVDAFDTRKADFSNMSSTPDLVVSKVLHKSFVEVNEKGAEAVSAIEMESRLLSAPIPQDFSCNHPFLFVMKQNKTNSILFFGRMSPLMCRGSSMCPEKLTTLLRLIEAQKLFHSLHFLSHLRVPAKNTLVGAG